MRAEHKLSWLGSEVEPRRRIGALARRALLAREEATQRFAKRFGMSLVTARRLVMAGKVRCRDPFVMEAVHDYEERMLGIADSFDGALRGLLKRVSPATNPLAPARALLWRSYPVPGGVVQSVDRTAPLGQWEGTDHYPVVEAFRLAIAGGDEATVVEASLALLDLAEKAGGEVSPALHPKQRSPSRMQPMPNSRLLRRVCPICAGGTGPGSQSSANERDVPLKQMLVHGRRVWACPVCWYAENPDAAFGSTGSKPGSMQSHEYTVSKKGEDEKPELPL